MNRLIVLVAGALLAFATFATGAWAEVAPCNFSNPWQVVRGVNSGEVEYPYPDPQQYPSLTPTSFEVTIFKRVGSSPSSSTCMFTQSPGVSLVVPNGFNTEEEHNYREFPSQQSWIKVGSASFPIVSKYKLAVVPAPKTKVISLPSEQTSFIGRELLLAGVNPPEKESRCGGLCGAGLVLLAVLAYGLYEHNHHHDSTQAPPPPTGLPGGTTNPAAN